MRSGDSSYLERRAEDELVAAQQATHPGAVRAHYNLASLYLDRLYGEGAHGELDKVNHKE